MADSAQELAQSLEPGGIVTLYDLDLGPTGVEQVIRFTHAPDAPRANDPHPAITFDGNTYTPIPIRAKGFGRVGDGAPPRPRLAVSLIDPAVSVFRDRCLFG